MGPDRSESGLAVDFMVSRTVRDTAALLDATAGPAVGDSVIAPPPTRPYLDEVGADPGRLRIGLLDRAPLGGPIHEDCVDAVRAAARHLEALGHDVAPGSPASLDDESFAPKFMALWTATRAINIAGYGTTVGRVLEEHEVEPVNWAMATMASGSSAADYAAALAAVADFRRQTGQWWADGWDLLLTPTLAEPPLPIGALYENADHPLAPMIRAGEFTPFTPTFNTTGQPAISVPLGVNAHGLPIGIQLVAAYGRDDLLIRVAAQLEAAHPWAARTPGSTH